MIPPMTERGLPIVDGAPACPFVALDEDRDGRALSPDHRHRCYAEPRPAPRALAHQEAYCLSSAFPVCPTFQDWARREAAAARAPEPAPRPERSAPPPVSRPMPPLERDPRHAPDDPNAARRNPHRDWAAPPPWSAEDEAAARSAAVPPAFLAPREAEEERYGTEGRGLAGSAADRLAGGGASPIVPTPRAPEAAPPASPPVKVDDVDEIADEPAWVAAPPPPPPTTARSQPQPRPQQPRPEPRRADLGPADHVSPLGEDPSDLFGPVWERPRRYEAYPTLKTRMGLPGIPRAAVAGVALLLAAVALFFWGPLFLGIGDNDGNTPGRPGGSASPTAAAPSESIEPTPTPAPTPTVHLVAAGDTLSRIATQYGLTLEQLLAANPQITNPNRISIGDQIIIPTPPPAEVPGVLPNAPSP